MAGCGQPGGGAEPHSAQPLGQNRVIARERGGCARLPVQDQGQDVAGAIGSRIQASLESGERADKLLRSRPWCNPCRRGTRPSIATGWPPYPEARIAVCSGRPPAPHRNPSVRQDGDRDASLLDLVRRLAGLDVDVDRGDTRFVEKCWIPSLKLPRNARSLWSTLSHRTSHATA